MSAADALRARARAEDSFTTIQLDCLAEYNTAQLEAASGRSSSGGVRIADPTAENPQRFRHDWRVWWRRPDCWRDDIIWDTGHSAVSIVCGGASSSHVSALDPRHMPSKAPSFLARLGRRFTRQEFSYEPTLAERLSQMPLVQPQGLMHGWSLATRDSVEHIGRAALRVRATRGPDAAQFGMWDYVDVYDVDIDQERGVLLRCAAIIGGSEASVLTVRSVRFDEPISAEPFAPAGA